MAVSPSSSSRALLTVLFLLTFSPTRSAEDVDATGKKITFYPSSLMLSHNVKPLIFFSDTRLMHLTTRLRPISAGSSLDIQNSNCSIPQNDFFNSLLHSIHSTQKVITRLLSMSSFSNLLECDSYLGR